MMLVQVMATATATATTAKMTRRPTRRPKAAVWRYSRPVLPRSLVAMVTAVTAAVAAAHPRRKCSVGSTSTSPTTMTTRRPTALAMRTTSLGARRLRGRRWSAGLRHVARPPNDALGMRAASQVTTAVAGKAARVVLQARVAAAAALDTSTSSLPFLTFDPPALQSPPLVHSLPTTASSSSSSSSLPSSSSSSSVSSTTTTSEAPATAASDMPSFLPRTGGGGGASKATTFETVADAKMVRP